MVLLVLSGERKKITLNIQNLVKTKIYKMKRLKTYSFYLSKVNLEKIFTKII